MQRNQSQARHQTLVTLTLVDLTDAAEADAFVTFMTTEPFPMHASGPSAPEQVQARINRGDYTGADNAVYWLPRRPWAGLASPISKT